MHVQERMLECNQFSSLPSNFGRCTRMVAGVLAADATVVGETLLERLIEMKEGRSSFSNVVTAVVMMSPKMFEIFPLSHLIDIFGEFELVLNIFEDFKLFS